MNNSILLTRIEMKKVMAGSGSCRVAYRNTSDGSFHSWSSCMSLESAQSMFENNSLATFNEDTGLYDIHFPTGPTYASGYCCASCGEEGFSTAQPC